MQKFKLPQLRQIILVIGMAVTVSTWYALSNHGEEVPMVASSSQTEITPARAVETQEQNLAGENKSTLKPTRPQNLQTKPVEPERGKLSGKPALPLAASTPEDAAEKPGPEDLVAQSAPYNESDAPDFAEPTSDQIVIFEKMKQNMQKFQYDENFDLTTFMSDPRLSQMHASQSHELISSVMANLENIVLKRDQPKLVNKTE